MRRKSKLKVGDLVSKINRHTGEVWESIWVVTRYLGDGLWEIANIRDLTITQVHHTLSLRRAK